MAAFQPGRSCARRCAARSGGRGFDLDGTVAESPPLPPDAVLVKVNGEPVLEKDVAMALPAGDSKVDASWVREFRLERRIRLVSVRQFLTANAVSVPDDTVEQTLQDMKKNPPSLGCPCCRFPTPGCVHASQYLTPGRTAAGNPE